MKTSTRTAGRANLIALCAATLPVVLAGGAGAAALGAWLEALRIVRTTPHRDIAARFTKALLAGEAYVSVRRLEMSDAAEYYSAVYRAEDARITETRIAA